VVLVLGVTGVGIYHWCGTAREAATRSRVQQLVGNWTSARSASCPTHCISDGLLAAARREAGAAFTTWP